jgi:hypothetical protein
MTDAERLVASRAMSAAVEGCETASRAQDLARVSPSIVHRAPRRSEASPRGSIPRTMRRRKSPPPAAEPVADRTWSARTNMHARDAAGKDLIRFTPLPAETGPTRAPDRLSVWPVEGGRFGIDAHYHGTTGAQRAERQRARLDEAGLVAIVRPDPDPGDGATLRLGPLAHEAAWLAIEAFLGRPLHDAP